MNEQHEQRVFFEDLFRIQHLKQKQLRRKEPVDYLTSGDKCAALLQSKPVMPFMVSKNSEQNENSVVCEFFVPGAIDRAI